MNPLDKISRAATGCQVQVLRFLSLALFLFFFWLLSLLSLALSAYLSCCGGLMFSFCFVDFLVFFWLIFKCFCFVSTYKSISYSTIFSLANLLCPLLSILLCRFVFVSVQPMGSTDPTRPMWVGLDLCDGLNFFLTYHGGLGQKIPLTKSMHTPTWEY